MKNVLKKIGFILIALILTWILLLFIYSLFYKITGLYKEEYLFKTKNTAIFFAKDDIMSPDIKKNEIVITRKKDDLNNGDIVYIEDDSGRKLTRIEGIKEEKGEIYYITKGIKNYYYNPKNSKKEDIVGKVVRVQTFGRISLKIATSMIFTIVSGIVILILLFISIKLDSKKKRRRQRQVEKTE